ncbi:MAG: aminoacyl-tRNA hydrolase [Firmicutes bacterium]|nr:aminoacyl-tRNA hydrolase [Bacillota bacterium]
MYIICGLGNPGKDYESTRHNLGFMTLDVLSSRLGISVNKLKFRALIGEGRIGTEKVVLVKPQTYMNLSGEALRPIMEFYKEDPSHLLVVYDDIDLEPGTIRIRPFGSAGTHNGMRSVIYQLQTDRFPRIRIGEGKNGVIPLERYVLMRIPENEKKLVREAVERAAEACESFVRDGIDRTMNVYNTKKTENGENS